MRAQRVNDKSLCHEHLAQVSLNTPTVDAFCSLCDCHTQTFQNIFPLFVCLIDSIVIFAFPVIVCKTTFVVRGQVSSNPFANTLSPIKIAINLSKHTLPQLIFIVALFSILLSKLMNYMNWRDYCLVAFIFTLNKFTLNIFLGSISKLY